MTRQTIFITGAAGGDVATCVWEAYQSDKLHWYVPPELVERDRAKSENPEQLRDELIARQKT